MDPYEEDVMEQNQCGNYKYQWTVQTTKLLIEKVRNHMGMLSNKNCMQKKVWKKIANKFIERGYNVTEEQCSVKWKNLKRRYKNVRDLNNQTGGATESWEYYDLIDAFINAKPEIAPVSVASSTHGFRIRQPSPPTQEIGDSTDENSAAAANTSYNTGRNIRKRRRSDEPTWVKTLYEQRKVHHEDNVKIKNEFLELFKKYVQKENVQENVQKDVQEKK
ncbi:uncharacterized protein LOC112462501 [Temnothorax curvispinosus]|uniref:Uncharacterized protein LOC112462501 n=1 Tax=Temnothorax curvispinosus TaxID=300111 RepID=A0A6J1QSX7_9HYME|nr:uncharacterized protein LOC112462501 [Temnothorax curvispinosus]